MGTAVGWWSSQGLQTRGELGLHWSNTPDDPLSGNKQQLLVQLLKQIPTETLTFLQAFGELMSKYLEKEIFKREGGRWELPTISWRSGKHPCESTLTMSVVLVTQNNHPGPSDCLTYFSSFEPCWFEEERMRNCEGWRKPYEFCLFGHLFMHIAKVPQEAAAGFIFICSSGQRRSLGTSMLCSESRIFKGEIYWMNSVLPFCFTFLLFIFKILIYF